MDQAVKRQYRILVVDDNPAIHEDFKKILIPSAFLENEKLTALDEELFGTKSPHKSPFNYSIDSALDGLEAVRMVQQALVEDKPYALVFMDVLMPPGMDGVETTKTIWRSDKDLQVVLCTAYADYSWEDITDKLGFGDNYLILKKPFESIEIRQMAACLTEKWALGQEAGHRFDRLNKEVLEITKEFKSRLHLPQADG